MITRGRSRQSALQDPVDLRSPSVVSRTAVPNPVPPGRTRLTRHLELRRKSYLTASPGKKAVPSDLKERVTKARSEIVRELDSVDPEGSDVEVESIVDPYVELEQLKTRMAELEV